MLSVARSLVESFRLKKEKDALKPVEKAPIAPEVQLEDVKQEVIGDSVELPKPRPALEVRAARRSTVSTGRICRWWTKA